MTDMTDMTWTPKDDIELIQSGNWPSPHVLCMKKPSDQPSGDYECGCIIPEAKSIIIKTNVWDWNPQARKIKYDSVEEMVADGWMVD